LSRGVTRKCLLRLGTNSVVLANGEQFVHPSTNMPCIFFPLIRVLSLHTVGKANVLRTTQISEEISS